MSPLFHDIQESEIVRSLIVLLMMAVSTMSAAAQQHPVAGRVLGTSSDGATQPLARATVLWRGTSHGTYTDADGLFRLERHDDGHGHAYDSLEIRYVGYETVVLAPTSDSIEVVMKPVTADAVTVEAEQPMITRATQKTEILTAKDLTKAACCSLAESFEKSGSVEVSYSDAVSGARQIQLLGLRGSYTQFLTEAVPSIRGMELPYGLDHIPGPFMESVSISKGASSVIFGYEGMTGQINVEFKKPTTSEKLFVNAYGNSLGRGEINITSALPVGDEWSTMIMAHGRLFNGTVDQNADGFLDMPNFRQLNLLNRWWFNNDEVEIQILGRIIRDEYASGQTGTSFDQDRPSLARYGIRTTIDRYEGFAKVGLLNIMPDVEGSSVALVVNGSWHDNASFFGVRTYDGSQRSLGARAILALPFSDDVKFIGGLSYQYDDVRERIMVDTLNRKESVPGVFAEMTLSPLKNLTFIAGARVDAHNLYGTFWTPRMHLRYALSDMTTLRASAGRGFRVATVVAENISAFISSMTPRMDSVFRPEQSWNYGVSLTHSLELFDRIFTFDGEVYHTEFADQIVVDFDRTPGNIYLGNLAPNGRSFATSAMLQMMFSPIPRLDLHFAYRWVDVQTTFGDTLRQRPMMSRTRFLATASYLTEGNDWQFDATFIYNGEGRLPSTAHLPADLRRGDSFPGFIRINGQITRKFDILDLYVGVENLTNYFQQDPIISPQTPYGPHFDASMAWGPMDQRMVYFGVRYSLN